MKRLLLLVLALVCLATGAFAVDFGIGASAQYYVMDYNASGPGLTLEDRVTYIPFDFLAYLDFNYLQLSAGYRTFKGTHEKYTANGVVLTDADFSEFSSNWISFAAYLKFPVQLGSVKLFPMVGVEYDLTLSATDQFGNEFSSQAKSDLNEFWFKAGLGADISISPQIYVRPELIAGYKLRSKPENDQIASDKASGATDSSFLDLGVQFDLLLGVRM